MIGYAFNRILTVGMPVIERNFNYNYLVLNIISFLIFIIIIIIKLAFKDYFHSLFLSIFRSQKNKIRKIKTVTRPQLGFLSWIVVILSISATLMMFAIYFNHPWLSKFNGIVFSLSSILATIFYFLFVFLSIKTLSQLVNIEEHAKYYIFIKLNRLKLISLLLLPIFLVYPFVNSNIHIFLVITAMLIIGVNYLINLLSFFSYLFEIKFLNHYAILYFCSFEILPLLIIFKLVGILK